MNGNDRILADALSQKLFGKNANPHPSPAWFAMATEEEIAEWQRGGEAEESWLADRQRVRNQVAAYSFEESEDLEVLGFSTLAVEEDPEPCRRIPVESFTLQQVVGTGRSKRTRCVFHDDSSPSCYLYGPEGFYCFSCGRGGNAVDWAMQEFSLSFRQALEFLERYAA